MPSIPSKVQDRLVAGIKRFQPVLTSARTRDVNESDTVIIVTEIISEVLGFDKFTEITSEHAIRGTFCDLAITVDGKFQFLVETKAIGIELKEHHVTQAVGYAAKQGVDWVVLTNGATWRIYRVSFAKPIDQDLIAEFDFLALTPKKEGIDLPYLLTREAFGKRALGAYHEQRQALSKFSIAAAILSEPVVGVIRRELRRLSPDVKIEPEQIREVLSHDVLKREVIEGDKAEEAKRKISKAAAHGLRARRDETNENNAPTPAVGMPTPTMPLSSPATSQPPPPASPIA